MRKQITPMYQFYVADFFRNLDRNFRSGHLEVDMKLLSIGLIEINLPIIENFICVINIEEEIRLRFYKELKNGKRHYILIPFELGIEYFPSMFLDIVEMDEKGIFIYPHTPIYDIIRVICFVKKNGTQLLPVLRKAYKTTTNKKNYEPVN